MAGKAGINDQQVICLLTASVAVLQNYVKECVHSFPLDTAVPKRSFQYRLQNTAGKRHEE